MQVCAYYKLKRKAGEFRSVNQHTLKVFGLAITCFSIGTLVQVFVPDVFIVMMLASILLVIGIVILRS